jgi:ABC transporter, ATP-binding protein
MKNNNASIKELINAHPVVKMPDEINKRKNLILSTEIFFTAIGDFLSFSVKLAQLALLAGHNILALIMIIAYFLKSVLRSAVQSFTDAEKQLFNSQADAYITSNISQIANSVRGKVFKTKNGIFTVLENSEVIVILKDYINYIWLFFQNLPITIANIITAVVMLLGTFFIELKQSGNSNSIIFLFLLIICIIIFIILYLVRIRVRKRYKYDLKEYKKKNEVLFNDIKNIEPLITEEFSFRSKLVINILKLTRLTEKAMVHKLNQIQVVKDLCLSLFMITIIIFKICSAGGVTNLSIELITDIIAISSIYSAILDKISSILDSLDRIKDTKLDAESLKSDFDSIIETLRKEEQYLISSKDISKIEVRPFAFSYPNPVSAYRLENKDSFILEKGKAYLVYGHTGCGKSTFMHLLTGKIKLETSPIFYGNSDDKAYLASIMHESNGRLGSNPILEEIIFSNDPATLDESRLIDILKGTNIYFDIMKNLGLTTEDDLRILEYLSTTTIEQYSSGQKQRLAIVKVLYNLNSTHKIVVFDEATNALDDKTAKTVLSFMANYCQKDMKRIVFFVSHQVKITREITDGEITFLQKSFPSYEVTVQI